MTRITLLQRTKITARNKLKNIYVNNKSNIVFVIAVRIRKFFFNIKHIYNSTLLKRRGFKVINNIPITYKSSLRLDIVFCSIERDLITLEYSLKSIRKYLMHPINKVYVVAPNSEKIIDFCNKNKCIFINEEDNFPFTLNQINYEITINNKKYDRSGWLFQQFLGLSGDLFCEESNYLLFDSDTVLNRPQTFEYNGKCVLNYADTVHKQYFIAYEKLFGNKPICPASLTSHMMIINKDYLKDMKTAIKNYTGNNWYEEIINMIDNKIPSLCSDYENYAQFVLSKHKDTFLLSYWYNETLFRSDLNDSHVDKKIKSISYHHYNN